MEKVVEEEKNFKGKIVRKTVIVDSGFFTYKSKVCRNARCILPCLLSFLFYEPHPPLNLHQEVFASQRRNHCIEGYPLVPITRHHLRLVFITNYIPRCGQWI